MTRLPAEGVLTLKGGEKQRKAKKLLIIHRSNEVTVL